MSTDQQLRFAENAGRYYVEELGFPPVAGRALGYLAVCNPAEQTIAELAETLLASRSAITQAVALLESRGLAYRSRARGERVDRVRANLSASTFEGDLEATGYTAQAELLRAGARLLEADESGRQQALEEIASLYDFLADRLPQLKDEWIAHRATL